MLETFFNFGVNSLKNLKSLNKEYLGIYDRNFKAVAVLFFI